MLIQNFGNGLPIDRESYSGRTEEHVVDWLIDWFAMGSSPYGPDEPRPIDRSFVLHNLISAQESPVPLTFRNRYSPNTPFYIFFQQISVLNFFNLLHTLCFFSSKCRLFHNATFFGACIIRILHTGCAKI
jgi:hypothetical protein